MRVLYRLLASVSMLSAAVLVVLGHTDRGLLCAVFSVTFALLALSSEP